MVYNINFNVLAQRLSPPDNREPVYVAWMRSLLQPLQEFRDYVFNVYRPDVLERTKYNAQTIVFEALLNKKFGTTNIYIDNTDFNNQEPVFTYNEGEGYEPIYLYTEGEGQPLYLFNEAEYNPDFDFIVYCPAALTDKLQQIKATIETYKLVGTKYDVKFF